MGVEKRLIGKNSGFSRTREKLIIFGMLKEKPLPQPANLPDLEVCYVHSKGDVQDTMGTENFSEWMSQQQVVIKNSGYLWMHVKGAVQRVSHKVGGCHRHTQSVIYSSHQPTHVHPSK